MATIEKSIKHGMSLENAKEKAASLVQMIETKYSSIVGDIKWNDDKTAANVKGKGFKGEFKVDEAELEIKIELGLLARAFKGKIETELDDQLKDFSA